MKGLKYAAIASFIISLALLLWAGYNAVDKVPPYPEKITFGAATVVDGRLIRAGQDAFQKHGLMDLGSVWGHGTLRGPDFAATTLHLMGAFMREFYARQSGATVGFESMSDDVKAVINDRVIREIKTNTYDPATKTLALSPAREYAFAEITSHWNKLFLNGDKTTIFSPGMIADAGERAALAAFFFWTAWAAGTNRPGQAITYTNNWPPDPSVGNTLSSDAFSWSIVSLLALLAILGLLVYVVHRWRFFYGEPKGPKVAEMLMNLPLTKSQLAGAKFFLVVILLFILQMSMGGLIAHYTVHPGTFYLPGIAGLIPYNWAKTWHLQLAIFWMVTSWIGAAVYIAPLLGGREPRGQAALVNLLFAAVILVAVGSLAGEALGITGLINEGWFWIGHQGWEYLELGRLWQILLFAGLIAWLFIVYRALKGRLSGPDREESGLIAFYLVSAILVVGFFVFGFFYGRGTHLTIADYWRWYVVHIWVESVFEFFGVAIIALFLTTLGLVDKQAAMRVAYLTAILVFTSGILGMPHHQFWFGGPSFWLAVGGVFSSLEPIPLILLVARSWSEYKSIRDAGGDFPYRWPFFFLVASSFWNFLGAGVFGFLINLPVINYYEHATYLTSNHAHTALFGVYGMFSISLLLFTWRSLVRREHWNDRLLKISFWGLNGGLFLMFAGTLFPLGTLQTGASYARGLWFARSAEFYNQHVVQMLGAWRIVPDTIMIVFGALPLLYFLITTRFRLKPVQPGSQELYGPNEHIL